MDSKDTNQPVAGPSCHRQLVFKKFRNFQKTQNIISGRWCMDSKNTDHPQAAAAGWSSCPA